MKNSLKEQKFDNKTVEYEVDGEKVQLSPNIIRNFLVNGNGKVTDQEVVMFLNLCRYQKLNPFLREAYLIKYGDKYPATMVVGKDVFTKRAENIDNCKGWQAGVVVLDKDGALIEREGTLILDSELLVGGWAMVYKSNWKNPFKHTVSYDEYEGRKADGSANSQWLRMPATMIRKVALTQALREAFPSNYQGLYTAEEIHVEETLPEEPVELVETSAEPTEHQETIFVEETLEPSIDDIF